MEVPRRKECYLPGGSMAHSVRRVVKPADLLNTLKPFLEKSLREPALVFEYLQRWGKCEGCATRGCEELIPPFSAPKPWENSEKFFQWCWKWFTTGHYEEPVHAVFLIPSVAQFLQERGVRGEEVSRSFRMEFKGKGEKEAYVPPCLWKSGPGETICIAKRWGNSYMCCDFYLLEPFPNTVVEVKVAVPHQNVKSNLTGFKKALEKCEEWLKPDTAR